MGITQNGPTAVTALGFVVFALWATPIVIAVVRRDRSAHRPWVVALVNLSPAAVVLKTAAISTLGAALIAPLAFITCWAVALAFATSVRQVVYVHLPAPEVPYEDFDPWRVMHQLRTGGN